LLELARWGRANESDGHAPACALGDGHALALARHFHHRRHPRQKHHVARRLVWPARALLLPMSEGHSRRARRKVTSASSAGRRGSVCATSITADIRDKNTTLPEDCCSSQDDAAVISAGSTAVASAMASA